MDVIPGGLLARITASEALHVNSLHRQAVGRLGEGLQLEARGTDGCVEAVSVVGAEFALGVQWHPEWPDPAAGSSGQLFREFGRAAARHRERSRRPLYY